MTDGNEGAHSLVRAASDLSVSSDSALTPTSEPNLSPGFDQDPNLSDASNSTNTTPGDVDDSGNGKG